MAVRRDKSIPAQRNQHFVDGIVVAVMKIEPRPAKRLQARACFQAIDPFPAYTNNIFLMLVYRGHQMPDCLRSDMNMR